MKTLLLAAACAVALAAPAQATMLSEADETTTAGLYYALAYDRVCNPGALTRDSKEFIALWLRQIPDAVRTSAQKTVLDSSSNFGQEIFCSMLRKTVGPRLPEMNSNATKVMGLIR